MNSTYELVRDLHELPSRIIFFLLAGDYSMRDFVTFFCRKKKDFKIGFLNHGTAGVPAAVFYIYIYIYIYIYNNKERRQPLYTPVSLNFFF